MDTEDLTSRVEEWSSRFQEEIDMDKATVEAVNTFMVVAAFIAGVQAQVIVFTIALPHSALQRAANLFAFLGLVFEVAGTFIGAIHSILLQRRSKNKSLLLHQITLLKADLKVVLKWYIQVLCDRRQAEQRRKEEESRRMKQEAEGSYTTGLFSNTQVVRILGGNFVIHNSQMEDRNERLERVETFIQEIQHHPLSSSQGYIIGAVRNILQELSPNSESVPSPAPKNNVPHRQSTQRTLDIVPPVVRPMFTFGNTPLISMAVGVAFLAISTILLAAASEVLASEVWISCIVALLSVMTLSLFPFIPWILKELTSYLNPKGGNSRIRWAA